MTMGDDKDKDIDIEPIADVELEDVQGGGGKHWPGTVTGKLIGNDTIVGVNNDTLFAGSGDDLKSLTIGTPRKR